MKTDHYGRPSLSENELIDALYAGTINRLDNLFIDSETSANQFNTAKLINFDNFSKLNLAPELTVTKEEFDITNQKNWFMPEEYKNFPLIQWLYSQCKTDQELQRVDEELELFVKNNMIDLLFYLKFLVDKMRQNNIVWGVGRGSSVASYVLYLIGIHRINPLKYNIKIDEFLKS